MAFSSSIVGLLMPMLSGGKDDYGTDTVPPLPLSIDRVSEGRFPFASAGLFQLPSEILGLILGYVPSESLANLALVSVDCLQLARSRQFASVHFDYSEKTLNLINYLNAERTNRTKGKKRSRLFFGSCIRRITVETHPGWIAYRHGVALNDAFKALSKDEREKRKEVAREAYFDVYIPSIQDILADPHTLPHLELLDWEDMIVLPPSFFESLTLSNIQHLKFFRVVIDKEFAIGSGKGSMPRQSPLRTLHLEIQAGLGEEEISVDLTCTSILRLCSSTLESLTWLCLDREKAHSFVNDQDHPVPQLESLRALKLDWAFCLDSTTWHALVKDRLQLLKVDTEADQTSKDFFKNRGTIPSLNTFVWRSRNMSCDHGLDFLQANPQLQHFSLQYGASPLFIEKLLLPLLDRSFQYLTSLSLLWDDTTISVSALEIVSRLKGLQQLHLSAGEQCGWKHDWLIDHNAMLYHVSQLPCLRRLAFSRDSYNVKPFGQSGHDAKYYDSYYEIRRIPRKFWEFSEEKREAIWEQMHKGMVLGQAHKYMRVLPDLEWLYFGQLPMRVTYSERNKKKIVETLSSERDGCSTFLQGMFNGGAD